MPENLLSEGDKLLFQKTGDPVAIEDLMAGKWLPKLLGSHLEALSNEQTSDFRLLVAACKSGDLLFRSKDLADLLAGRQLREEILKVTQNVEELAQLAKA